MKLSRMCREVKAQTKWQTCNRSRTCFLDIVFRIFMILAALLLWLTMMWSLSLSPTFNPGEARRNIATTGGVVFGVILHNAYSKPARREDTWLKSKLRSYIDAVPDFDGVQEAIETTGDLFPQYAVVLYENDSEDQTMDKVEAWGLRNDRVSACPCTQCWSCDFWHNFV